MQRLAIARAVIRKPKVSILDYLKFIKMFSLLFIVLVQKIPYCKNPVIV